MPEMDLFAPDRGLTVVRGIWARLLAYMTWPDDGKAREAYIASHHLTIMAAIDEHAGHPDYAETLAFVYEQFRALGGGRAVLNPFPPFERAVQPLRTAAAALDIIRRTPRVGSLNKAIHVLKETGKKYNFQKNKTDVIQAWNRYRGVSHLGVAFYNLWGWSNPKKPELDDQWYLDNFFLIARDYEIFATSYEPPGSKRPLIDAAAAWTIPADFHPPRALRWLKPLPEDMLAALRAYRAPKPGD